MSVTGWCYFKVDAERPHAPQVSIGSPYTECTADACAPHGGPDEAAIFTLTPDGADSDVTGYDYRLEPDGEWTSSGSGAEATVTVTPDTAGTKRIAVRAKDTTGPGAQSVLDFLVAAGDGPVGADTSSSPVAPPATPAPPRAPPGTTPPSTAAPPATTRAAAAS
ncbi:hypothetical protein [Streptomyces sp. NPDC053728]|uniref:hypothetical protein n=1 Tax=Streptomyces sp. NPDC053728 TaxID=3155534 RepID=UPI003430E65C